MKIGNKKIVWVLPILCAFVALTAQSAYAHLWGEGFLNNLFYPVITPPIVFILAGIFIEFPFVKLIAKCSIKKSLLIVTLMNIIGLFITIVYIPFFVYFLGGLPDKLHPILIFWISIVLINGFSDSFIIRLFEFKISWKKYLLIFVANLISSSLFLLSFKLYKGTIY